jgi:hypothetical protein
VRHAPDVAEQQRRDAQRNNEARVPGAHRGRAGRERRRSQRAADSGPPNARCQTVARARARPCRKPLLQAAKERREVTCGIARSETCDLRAPCDS